MKIKLKTSLFMGAIFASGLIGQVHAEEEKILNIYNWADYIAEDTVRNFEKETGIKVRYDSFDSNEVLHAKLVAGLSGYDLVVPSATFAKQQIEAKLFRPLDPNLIPNLKNLDPAIQKQLASADPGNKFLVNWLWGYTTVGINASKVKAALGTLPMPKNAWDLVFKPEYISKLKSCGVSFLASPSSVVTAALVYLGKSPNSTNQQDYAEVGKLFKSVRPYVTQFSSTYTADWSTGATCVAMGYSGDFGATSRKLGDKNLQTLIPTKTVLFFDNMAIPADAKHPDNAHKFINYILRPEVHASLTNYVTYANPNLASKQFIKPEIANDTTVFLSAADLAGMITPVGVDNATKKIVGRIFTDFKADNK